jgi:multisubunit Na+/H+ antiporter MnhB subunit
LRDDSYIDDDVKLTPVRRLILFMVAALTFVLVLAVFSVPDDVTRLAGLAQDRLPESGVDNPVTAVLINFRGYDTFLEVSVLLLAIIGVWSVARRARVPVKVPNTPVLTVFVRLLMPLMMIAAGYLLWIGGEAPGGAFQGGAILGGMGVLWIAAAVPEPGSRLRKLLRPVLVAGMTFFLGAGALAIVLGGSLMQYPEGEAKTWILTIESAATLSIGATLVMLFLGGQPDSSTREDGKNS